MLFGEKVMKETNNLFIKLNKKNPEYAYTKETHELNFHVELRAILVFFNKVNKQYENQADEVVLSHNNNIDFVLTRDAFKRYAKTVQKLYLEPFGENTINDINGLLDVFENKKLEDYLSYDITEEARTKFIFDMKMFKEYKQFLWVFIKHLECYLRFYHENLRKKYYFYFEHLVEVCYKNKNIEYLNSTLVQLCNKYCKPLKKYWRKR